LTIMKAIVLEIKDGTAAVLREDGAVVKTRQSCQVGETIELQGEIVPMPVRRKRKWVRSAVAAALALVIAGSSYTYTTAVACSYVSVDAEESSLELSVNRLGRVISVQAMNEDSAALAESLRGEVRNKKVEDALSQTVARLADEGYLDEEGATLVAGVTDGNARRSADLARTVERSMGFDGERVQLYTLEISPDERREAREMADAAGRGADVEVDGGIGLDNAADVLRAGANILVAGSAVYKNDAEENVRRFLALLSEA